MYQYMDALAKKKGKQVANTDLKVFNQVLNASVRWGVIDRQPLKGAVKPYGQRDGLPGSRDRYVEDWELAAWQQVPSRQQLAFAAIVMLTGIRKGDCLRIMEAHVADDSLTVPVSKNGRPVVFQMTDALRAAVEQARACKPVLSLYLLPNRKGECYVNEGASRSHGTRAGVVVWSEPLQRQNWNSRLRDMTCGRRWEVTQRMSDALRNCWTTPTLVSRAAITVERSMPSGR